MEKYADKRPDEYDVIAFALFRNGLVKSAVEYQKLAVRDGKRWDGGFRKRLAVYERALAKSAKKPRKDRSR